MAESSVKGGMGISPALFYKQELFKIQDQYLQQKGEEFQNQFYRIISTVPDLYAEVKPPEEEQYDPAKEEDSSGETMHLDDLATLLSFKNKNACVCCNNCLFSNAPPALLIGRKYETLNAFCNILNLPLVQRSAEGQDGKRSAEGHQDSNGQGHGVGDGGTEDLEERTDFPFCHYCTKKKVLKLTQLYEKIQLQQANFDTLKEAILKDILRVFIANLVTEHKVPLNVIREARAFDKMFDLLKKHSERRRRNHVDKDIQTDFSPFWAPSTSSVDFDNWTPNKKRGRKANHHHNKQSEGGAKLGRGRPRKLSSSTNLSDHYLISPIKKHKHSSGHHRNHRSPVKRFTGSNNGDIDGYGMDSLDSSMNGMSFPHPIEDNGPMDIADGYFDFTQNFDSKDSGGWVANGLIPDNTRSLSEALNNAIGLADDGSVSCEVVVPSSEPVLPPSYSRSSSFSVPGTGRRTTAGHRLRNSTDKKQMRCPTCNVFINKDNFKQHMERIHGDDRPYKCRGCDKTFCRRDNWNNHEETHATHVKRLFFCHRCGTEKILSKYMYIDHCVDKHGIEDDIVEFFYFCDECSESFKNREDFHNHLKTHWPVGSMLICSECDKAFADSDRLETHTIEAHRPNVPYHSCQFCHMGFENETDFNVHLDFHKVKIPDERSHNCDICTKKFESAHRLKYHKYNMHLRKGRETRRRSSAADEESEKQDGDEDDREEEAKSVEDPEMVSNDTDASNDIEIEKKFKCTMCSKSYLSDSSLKRHQQKMHPIGKIQIKDLVNKKNAKKHKKKKSKEKYHATCTFCKESFTEPDEFESHDCQQDNESQCSEAQSKPGTGHRCKYCGRERSSSQELRRHLCQNHAKQYLQNGIKKHCIVCFNLFETNIELQSHYDIKHSKFKCQTCGTMCTSSYLLKVHQKRHSSNLPYVCDVCGVGFKASHYLRRHKKNAHAVDEDESSDRRSEDSDEKEEYELPNPTSNSLNTPGGGSHFDHASPFDHSNASDVPTFLDL